MAVPIQNLRSGTATKRPVASGLAFGQVAVNYNETDPAVYFRGHNNALIKVAPTFVGSGAPNTAPASGGASGNAVGEQWLDTTGGDYVTKVWDGVAWRSPVVTSSLIKDDTIVNGDISVSANIADSKLATISTAGKVSGSAITSGTISGSTAINTSGNIATTGTVAVGQASAAANTELDLAGTYAQTIVAVAALNIDCSTGNYFTKTINGASTFTVSNVPASRSYAFTLELTHTSGAITWFSNVEWPGSTAPTLTTGKTHLFMFVTDDGGTRWRASSLINYTT